MPFMPSPQNELRTGVFEKTQSIQTAAGQPRLTPTDGMWVEECEGDQRSVSKVSVYATHATYQVARKSQARAHLRRSWVANRSQETE